MRWQAGDPRVDGVAWRLERAWFPVRDGISGEVQRQEKADVPVQKPGVRRGFSLTKPGVSLFVLLRPSTGRMCLMHVREGELITQSIKLIQNTLTDTPRILCDQVCGHPVSQSSRHLKLTTRGHIYNLLAQGIWGGVWNFSVFWWWCWLHKYTCVKKWKTIHKN